ncbi:signal peptidase I [Candidatus Roizmanbacteria bacterium CG_4_9_14_0_8_um_filter_34_12]|uniref:Signal peptidase I n=2 Tax=Candidatus Roizmaniibacteriota TaxID=1752723 RepID=A0A2M7LUR4_9BACT|nr:MAG: signal peptidase I [Candidatus Roizmanbacteria bacterium CG_4_10_14_3_um_filter_33_21]PJB87729.1 MAG: signal peptidase I [Candidatus Roizmanbacteria bacterium CG_4_9_14_0_8_um_filter_34_12]
MKIVKGLIEFVMEILETVVFVGSIFIVTYLFIMQPNQVKGASMEPTFLSGEYIFTSKITYKFRPMQKGDVVIFKSPKNPDIEYIKRVMGLPGDKVLVQNSEVYINGQQISENYISAKTNLWEGGFLKEGVTVTIPDGFIFVMGDNRPRSSDSREFGPININSIIGQVFYRYFPSNKIGPINNPIPPNLRSYSFLTYFFT